MERLILNNVLETKLVLAENPTGGEVIGPGH